MYLNTERCLIRPMAPDDAADLFEVLSDGEVMRYIEPVFDMARTRAFIRDTGMRVPPPVYAVRWQENGRVIGHVIFNRIGNDCEIGWILNRQYWGRGVARELTKALLVRARAMNAETCFMECAPSQAATRHIALENGFVYEGRSDGLDVYRYTFDRR